MIWFGFSQKEATRKGSLFDILTPEGIILLVVQ